MNNAKKLIIVSGLCIGLIGLSSKKAHAVHCETVAKYTVFAPLTYSCKALKNTVGAIAHLYNGEIKQTAKKIGYVALDTGIAAGSTLAMLYAYSMGAELLATPQAEEIKKKILLQITEPIIKITKPMSKACAKLILKKWYKEDIANCLGRVWNDNTTLNKIFSKVAFITRLSAEQVKTIAKEMALL